MNMNIWRDFQICISVPLMDHYHAHKKYINIGSALSKRKDGKHYNNTSSVTLLEYATQVSEVL